jgi:hypothetical protein
MAKGSLVVFKLKGGQERRTPPFRRDTAAAGKRHDVRIAIGIGKADFYDLNDIGRSDGEAFRMSGLKLDEMKNMKRNLVIVTPWDDLNGELDVECALLDVVISKWTRGQALSVFYSLQGLNQYQIAERLGLYQGGISQRLAKAGYWAIEMMLARFDEMIDEHDLGSISSRTRGIHLEAQVRNYNLTTAIRAVHGPA